MIGANIEKFIMDIVGLVENKKTQDIVDISNESSKDGIRIVLELKKGADPVKIENMLYKKTRLEDTFGVNMLVIADGKPEVLGLKDILQHCIDFQYEINTRKYNHLLAKDMEQKEIKEGLIRACDIIDLIIEIIRGSQSIAQAKACLVSGETKDIKFKSKESEKQAKELKFTEKQASAILDLRLAKLIGLEILQLKKEYEELEKEIAEFEKILSDPSAMKKVIIKELEEIKKEYGFDRKTQIVDAEAAVYEEEKIKEQEVVLLMDRFGYAKTVETSVYDKNSDAIDSEYKYVIRCMNTDRVCIFTQSGVMHQLKMTKVPVKKLKDKGIPVDNLCNYTSTSEDIVQVFSMEQMNHKMLLFTTKLGMMKFVEASEFDVSKQTVAATKLLDGDEVISIDLFDIPKQKAVKETFEEVADVTISGGYEDDSDSFISYSDDDDQLTFEFFDLGLEDDIPAVSEGEGSKPQFTTNKMVVLQTKDGLFLRFRLNEVPEKKKTAVGVRAIKLGAGDEIDKVYIVGFGSKDTIKYHDKDIELMKIKLAKRDTKGIKLRS